MTTGSPATGTIVRRATPADAGHLAGFAATAFIDTFAADNRPEDMANYLTGAFGETIQRRELADPTVTVLLAERDGETVGYAMLRQRNLPGRGGDGEAIEIARLYAAKRSIGAGVGAQLMHSCLDEAASSGKDSVWLGVWERNARAIAFYRRWGFERVGTQPFRLGSDPQTDHIMARRVDGRG